MPANLENSAVATGLEKVSFHSSLRERRCQRMFNYRTIALISYASKVMFKILQEGLQQYVNRELPNVQAGFRKDRGTRDQITSNPWIIKKARVPGKHLLYWLRQCLWLYGSQQTVENSSRDGNTRPPYMPPQKSVCRSGSNSYSCTWNTLVLNWNKSVSGLYIVTLLI